MSRTALVVALLVAVGLAAAGFFLLRDGTVAGGPVARVFEFDPATIRLIEIRRDGALSERLERTADAAEWELVLTDPNGLGESRWPVMTPQVRGLLRVLSDLPGEPGEPSADARFATSVLLTTTKGSTVGFEVADTMLSGRVPIRTFDDEWIPWWVDAQVAGALRREGVLMWRDRTLLRGIGPETSKVTLRGPGGSVTATRVLGKWGLTEPVAAAASQDAIERLVASIAALRAEEFIERLPPSLLWKPAASATITLTTRGADGAAVESMRTLEIGDAADLGGSRLYARVVEAGAAGPREYYATLDAAALKNLTTDPVSYIDPRGATFPAADVGSIVLAGHTYSRTTHGWDGEAGPVLPDDAAVLSALVQVVTEHAGAVALEPPAGASEWHDLHLRSLGGEPLAMLQVGINPADGKTPRAIVRDGAVWRVYTAPDDLVAVRAALGLAAR